MQPNCVWIENKKEKQRIRQKMIDYEATVKVAKRSNQLSN